MKLDWRSLFIQTEFGAVIDYVDGRWYVTDRYTMWDIEKLQEWYENVPSSFIRGHYAIRAGSLRHTKDDPLGWLRPGVADLFHDFDPNAPLSITRWNDTDTNPVFHPRNDGVAGMSHVFYADRPDIARKNTWYPSTDWEGTRRAVLANVTTHEPIAVVQLKRWDMGDGLARILRDYAHD